MKWSTDSITVSVEDCGKYIKISQSNNIESSCIINFRPEQVDILNQWLKEAKDEALELREAAMNMVYEGG
jgi:hypothetical protein